MLPGLLTLKKEGTCASQLRAQPGCCSKLCAVSTGNCECAVKHICGAQGGGSAEPQHHEDLVVSRQR